MFLINPEGDIKMYSKFLKKELKKEFGIDFKVRKDENSYYISYTDGVSENKLNKFVSKYLSGSFDPMSDNYVYHSGGFAKYIFIKRNMSEKAKEKVIEKIKERYGDDILDLSPEEQWEKLGTHLHFKINEFFKNMDF